MNLSRALATKRLIQPLTLLQTSLFSASTTRAKKQPKAEKESIAKWANLDLLPSPKTKLGFQNGTKLPQIETTWPKPTEIPWQAKVANSVNLIGYIAEPVQVELTDNKYIAGTVLKQEDSKGFDPLWIPIVFEGDLALVAACHLKKNDLVYIAGRVNGDPPKFTMEQGQSSLQVMVHSLNYVQESVTEKQSGASSRDNLDSSISASSDAKTQSPAPFQDVLDSSFSASSDAKTQSCAPFQDVLDSSFSDNVVKDSDKMVKEGRSEETHWNDLDKNRHQWVDYRNKKLNGTVSTGHPDFMHKDSHESLWLDNAPNWFRLKLDQLDSNAPKESVVKDGKSIESSWKDFIENGSQWVDRRKDKLAGLINPKFPDFTRIGSKEALWISSAPKWALDKLEIGENFSKTIGGKGPASAEESWKNLVENQNKWWDNRYNKRNPKAPDFKHKDTGDVLWLNSAPAWVLPKLPPGKSEDAGTHATFS